MNIRFLAPARQELDDAVAWYDQQADGLEKSSSMNWTGSSEELLPTPYPQ
jgi:hypothetical protein